MRTLWLVLVALCWSACGGDDAHCSVAQLTNYNTQCSVDNDCSPVFAGDTCSDDCLCPNAALNSSDLARYTAYLVTHSPGTGTCNCPAASAFCSNGSCKFGGAK